MDGVSRFITSDGRRIYCLPVQAFPQLVANLYVVSDGQKQILVDSGSGMPQSNEDLLAGLAAIEDAFSERVTLDSLAAIIITHGHIDHFGGLPFLRQHTHAPIWVHRLDRRVLSNYEERVVVASRQLEIFLERAGLTAEARQKLMTMYLFAKGIYRSTPVEDFLEEGQPAPLGIQVYHVPGHCPGQVCLRVDDHLLTADHILSRTTPHQSPESITHNTGLSHYLETLAAISSLNGVRLALGGHEAPMPDWQERVATIRTLHEERLERVLEICRQPKSVADVSQELFGRVSGYHVLLAVEEAGAHVEYLYERGELVAANWSEIEVDPAPVICYERA